ncbi:MAG: ABC transporter substrate-binding protein [Salibacteraceae bacterium]
MIRKIAWLLLVATAWVACQSPPDPTKEEKRPRPSDWSTENKVSFHLKAEPNGLHPTHGLTDDLRYFMFNYTQMRLIQDDIISNTIRPSLVRSLPETSADQLTFTYELREEPRWDDGTPLTIDDVLFTLKLHKCPLTNNPGAKPYINNLKAFEPVAENDRAFRLVMKQPYFQNVSFLVDFPILQQSFHDPENQLGDFTIAQFDDPKFRASEYPQLVTWINEHNDGKYGRNPDLMNGLGPYKITSWNSDQSLTLQKKPGHWMDELGDESPFESAYPGQITFRFVEDPNAILLQFKQQGFDGSTSIPVDQMLQLQQDPEFNRNYESKFVPLYNYTFMGMNQKPEEKNRNPVFTDRLTRRAVALLAPADEIIQVLYQGHANRIAGVVSPLKPDYNTELKPLKRNAQRATELLKEAGWADKDQDGILERTVAGKDIRFTFSLTYPAVSDRWKDMARMFSEALAEAGIEAVPEGLEFGNFVEKLSSHNFDAALMSWSSQARPDDFTQVWHTESWSGSGSNFFGFGNAYSDSLIEAYRATVDDDARVPISQAFQQFVFDDQPYVFLLASRRRTALHRRFENRGMYSEKPGVLLNFLQLGEVAPRGAAFNP